jgi:RNA polymerase sigma factor (sigma-70 family)
MSHQSADAFFAAMGAYRLLEAPDVITLAREVQAWQTAKGGPDAAPVAVKRAGIKARNQLASHNLRLVVRVWARSFSARVPSSHPDLGDALQMAAMGLVRAAEKFDPSQGRTFSTYADAWIRKGFQDYLRSAAAIRVPCDYAAALYGAHLLLEAAQSARKPIPSWVEIREALLAEGRKANTVPSAANLPAMYEGWRASKGILSTDTPVGDEGTGATLGDYVPAPEPDGPSLLERVQANLCRLDAVQRRVLEMSYRGALPLNGQKPSRQAFSPQQIARTVGCKPEELGAIKARALGNLRLFTPLG